MDDRPANSYDYNLYKTENIEIVKSDPGWLEDNTSWVDFCTCQFSTCFYPFWAHFTPCWSSNGVFFTTGRHGESVLISQNKWPVLCRYEEVSCNSIKDSLNPIVIPVLDHTVMVKQAVEEEQSAKSSLTASSHTKTRDAYKGWIYPLFFF